MSKHTTGLFPADKAEICNLYLDLLKRDSETLKRNRIYYIRLSRKYGLTNAQIGKRLGLSEARVRQIARAA